MQNLSFCGISKREQEKGFVRASISGREMQFNAHTHTHACTLKAACTRRHAHTHTHK